MKTFKRRVKGSTIEWYWTIFGKHYHTSRFGKQRFFGATENCHLCE